MWRGMLPQWVGLYASGGALATIETGETITSPGPREEYPRAIGPTPIECEPAEPAARS
jgi:hypothetical protein